MEEQSKINWTDSTLNFWKHWGKGDLLLKSKSAVKESFKLNRRPWSCDSCGTESATKLFQCRHAWQTDDNPDSVMLCTGKSFHRRRIFSLSFGDWLDPEVPVEWLAEMLDTVRQCDQVTW